jgi:uncharacterized sporulation protein YeaH/YhbH (DUF444 family)
MARGKAISVKIATSKVINALETKLAEVKKTYAEQDKLQDNHKTAMEKWNKEVAKLAMSAIAKAEDLSAGTRWNGEINVSFNLPKGTIELPAQPEQDFETMHQWQYKETINEIENAIRILKMTDEEVVSTSTYNAIAQYL